MSTIKTTTFVVGQVLREIAVPLRVVGSVPEKALLRLDALSVRLPSRHGEVHAVRHVSLSVNAGECLGVVGESGCGKSTVCSAILSLLPDNARIDGRILFGGKDLRTISSKGISGIRGREIAMVFQDPMNSLNPVRRVGAQIADKIMVHKGLSRGAALAEAARFLDLVKVPAARERLNDYPHQLSGGLCQRIMIGMALSCEPKLLIADEPTTALDVTIQAQILSLLGELRRELGMAIILVSHDLGVIAQTSDRIAVMYAGEVVEEARTEVLLKDPKHPYTQGLIEASPGIEPTVGPLVTIPGSVVSLLGAPSGCAFAPRCRRANDKCGRMPPHLEPTSMGAMVACHFPNGWTQ
ncbi:ABC transporter ATP-binding protein [Mesorhizobium tianshanense]|uniref:Oligopeptide transport system ATP-binding protein n=1 Tax=Mesorhizobium tianshanense TaxID=39844 RepID=A0A562NBP6_9HYPH|nr:ABC transporter ATP-binding protein [Mesorhizobium tianshanense]TWI29544.1 oligopeptide transport system ATP-binding protein [Mesorhizobium tianshanense]